MLCLLILINNNVKSIEGRYEVFNQDQELNPVFRRNLPTYTVGIVECPVTAK